MGCRPFSQILPLAPSISDRSFQSRMYEFCRLGISQGYSNWKRWMFAVRGRLGEAEAVAQRKPLRGRISRLLSKGKATAAAERRRDDGGRRTARENSRGEELPRLRRPQPSATRRRCFQSAAEAERGELRICSHPCELAKKTKKNKWRKKQTRRSFWIGTFRKNEAGCLCWLHPLTPPCFSLFHTCGRSNNCS